MSKFFTVERLQPDDRKTINAVYRLMSQTFGSEELDSKNDFIVSLRDDVRVTQRVYVAKTENKVVGMIAGGLDKLSGGLLSILMVSYAATAESHRKQGIQRELFRAMLEDAERDAGYKDAPLRVISAEASSDSEVFWNKLGFDRVYAVVGDEHLEYHEIEYIQAAVDFNKTTGLPKKGAGEVPEHLMLASKDPIDILMVSLAVDAIYRWSSRWPRSDFKSLKAFVAHGEYGNNLQSAFESNLRQSGVIVPMSAEKRQQLIDQGGKVFDHTAADKDD